MSGSEENNKSEGTTQYLDRLTALIPSEFIAAYLAIYNYFNSTLKGKQEQLPYFLLAFFVILLCMLPFYLRSTKKALPGTILASCISFVIWVFSIGGILNKIPEIYMYFDAQIIMAPVIIIWTLYSPIMEGKFK